jgi:hypothetical protein
MRPTKYDPRIDGALSWIQVTTELCESRPIIYIVRWTGGGYHSLVASGYREAKTVFNFGETATEIVEKVIVSDSHLSGLKDIRYECFVQDCAGKWSQYLNYLDLKRS